MKKARSSDSYLVDLAIYMSLWSIGSIAWGLYSIFSGHILVGTFICYFLGVGPTAFSIALWVFVIDARHNIRKEKQ